jgi:integrase
MPVLELKAAETKEPREIVRELSLEEQRRLFHALPHGYHPLVTFALMTDARVATITNLLWSDVDLDNREITFRLKGDNMMTFPINPRWLRCFLLYPGQTYCAIAGMYSPV